MASTNTISTGPVVTASVGTRSTLNRFLQDIHKITRATQSKNFFLEKMKTTEQFMAIFKVRL